MRPGCFPLILEPLPLCLDSNEYSPLVATGGRVRHFDWPITTMTDTLPAYTCNVASQTRARK